MEEGPWRRWVEPTGLMSRGRFPLILGLCLLLSVGFPMAAPAATHSVATTKESIAVYAAVLRQYNPEMPEWQSKDLARHLLITANKERLDTNMLAAIVTVESSWRTHAVSYAGAIGLGQLMPGTAATLGVNPRDPVQNLQGAARYLRGLLQTFGAKRDRYALVFAAYNAGPKAVQEYGGIPPYSETQQYVVKVLRAWNQLRSIVHIPRQALVAAERPQAHGADIDYWLHDSAR
jgi:soluble lytic murein transglycosylase-like protein